MRIIFYLLIVLFAVGCSSVKQNQPLTGGNYGVIPNGSVKDVMSSKVMNWETDNWLKDATHFYDSEAVDGTKSLCISAADFAQGKWHNKVNLKPWSKYRFKGWIKTENVVPENRGGAAIFLYGVKADLPVISGTNGWTEVSCEFETGANDCAIINCLLGTDGKTKGKVWFDAMSFDLISSEKYKTNLQIDPGQQGAEMSEYIYGQFIEHMGKCIYGGIWAEMLEDRKFWYSLEDKSSSWKVRGSGESLFYMDDNEPFTGAHTPVLVANNNNVVLHQGKLGVRHTVGYSGYIIVKSDNNIPVDIILTTGTGKSQRVSINTNSEYKKYELKFSPTETTTNASIDIIPKGKGKVWIGTLSLMPDDNVYGFRADVHELLKGLKSPVYRWPGGNFVSGYDWKDGLGDRDKRPPRKNPAWTGVESNDVGLHEFIKLCQLIETEPYIAVNAGLGDVKQAAEEVEYCNGSVNTPMGKWRAENGSPEPWNVKWWSVGNEMFGDWQLGFMSTEAFVQKHNEFADAMWAVDPDIKLIGVGEVGPWDEMVLANCADKMDLISEHFYCQDWHGGGLMTHVLQIPREIKRRSDFHREYRKTIPALQGKDIQICMDEWNYWYGPHIYGELGTRYFLRDALGIAAGLNEFMRQSDIVYMANYAQTVNVIGCIKTTTLDASYDTTGEVLKMYREHFGTIPVNLTGELRPFDAVAAINRDEKTLTISIVNPTWDEITFDMNILDETVRLRNQEYRLEKTGKIYVLTGPSDMAYNTPGQESPVEISEERLSGWKKVTIKPYSANIISIPFK